MMFGLVMKMLEYKQSNEFGNPKLALELFLVFYQSVKDDSAVLELC
jgi:hypothetical protein